ncbi:dodecin [Methylobacterium nigriterrae]|uniref:dodecin n=1 Tax=Methylobacterium nigriterrae TaxID=3127512 RepID=UPI003013FA8F
MSHVYPVTEIYGSSQHSIDDAIRQAVASAQLTIRHLEWCQVTEIRGHVESDGSIGHFQVGVKLGFRLDRPSGRKE